MPTLKLAPLKELFPDKSKELEEEQEEYDFGKMFILESEEKTKIVKFIDAIVEEAKRQREGLMEIREESVRNYEGMEKITGPWDGSSNVSTMVTTIASDMIHAKLFPTVWTPETIHFIGTEHHDEIVAKNNEVLMQWALTKDMENTQDKSDEIVHRLVVDGTIAVKIVWETYYTYVTRIVPVSVTDKGDIIYEPKYDLICRRRGRWILRDVDYIYVNFNAENEQRAEYIVDEVYYTLPMLKEMAARELLLPDLDFDAISRLVEKSFDPQGTVKARYEASGIQAYYARMDSYPIKVYEAYVKYDINGDGIREECVFLVLPDQGIYIGGKPLHCISKIGRRPWLIRGFLRRPGIIYGKGIPELVRHLHKEMNIIHNQRLDAGNMIIAPFFFYRAASGMQPEEISIKPATGIPLDDPTRDVYFPDYSAGRLSVSFQEENILMDLIEKLTYLTPAMLGRETASRPTARGTLAVIAQGEQKFGLLAMRVQRIFSDLITMTRQMYEENLDPSIQRRVLGKDGIPAWSRLSPEMIAGQYDTSMELDLSSGDIAFEKQADQILFQTLVNDPLVNQSPAHAWELRAGYIMALGKKDVEKYIGPKPDMGDNPELVDDENARIMQEEDVYVNPNDNDLQHINSHQAFKRQNAKTLTPEARRKLINHNMSHIESYQRKLQQLSMVGRGNDNGGANAADWNSAGAPGTLSQPRMDKIQGPPVDGSVGGGKAGVPQY